MLTTSQLVHCHTHMAAIVIVFHLCIADTHLLYQSTVNRMAWFGDFPMQQVESPCDGGWEGGGL